MVAAAAGFFAAAISIHPSIHPSISPPRRQLLRIFSPSGVQTGLLSLPGPAVAVAAPEQGEGLLAVVTHAASPDITTKSQRLLLEVGEWCGNSVKGAGFGAWRGQSNRVVP